MARFGLRMWGLAVVLSGCQCLVAPSGHGTSSTTSSASGTSSSASSTQGSSTSSSSSSSSATSSSSTGSSSSGDVSAASSTGSTGSATGSSTGSTGSTGGCTQNQDCPNAGDTCVLGFTNCANPNVYVSESAGVCKHLPAAVPTTCARDAQCPPDMRCDGVHCQPVGTSGVDCSQLGASCQDYQPPHRPAGCICDACPAQACVTATTTSSCTGFTTCTFQSSDVCEDPDPVFFRKLTNDLVLTCEPFSPACQKSVCTPPHTRDCNLDSDCDLFEHCDASGKCDLFTADGYPPSTSICPAECAAGTAQPHQIPVLCDCATCPVIPPDAGPPDAGPVDAGPPPDNGQIFPQGTSCNPTLLIGCSAGFVCQRQYQQCANARSPQLSYACVPEVVGPCALATDCGDNYACEGSACRAIDCTGSAMVSCSALLGQELAYAHACHCADVALCAVSVDPGGPH